MLDFTTGKMSNLCVCVCVGRVHKNEFFGILTDRKLCWSPRIKHLFSKTATSNGTLSEIRDGIRKH